MIKTKKFQLTNKRYLQITLTNYWRRNKLLTTILVILMFYGFIKNDLFYILFPPFFFIILAFLFWRNAYSSKNKIFFKERYLEIDNEFLTRSDDDGSTAKVNLNNIVRLVKGNDYFLIYITKGQFIYTPFECFEKDTDIQAFETVIKKHLPDERGRGKVFRFPLAHYFYIVCLKKKHKNLTAPSFLDWKSNNTGSSGFVLIGIASLFAVKL